MPASKSYLRGLSPLVSLAIGLLLVSTAVFSDDLSQREQAAREVSQQFLQQLGGHLKSEMKTNGPEKAVAVCKEVAPQVASKLSLENGWRVTRVTDKTRNALLGSADAWEQKILLEFKLRAKAGESYKTMTKSEVVEEGGQSYFRFMKPLVIKPLCLSCHGKDEQIAEAIKQALDTAYPFDQARNYSIGDLRGAVSIKQPMAIPLRKRF